MEDTSSRVMVHHSSDGPHPSVNTSWVIEPPGKQYYPQPASSNHAKVRRLTDVVAAGPNGQRVVNHNGAGNGVAVFWPYGVISFKDDLVLHVVIAPPQAGEDWRRADTKSFCVTLGQSRRGRFYAPATVTITKGALSGPSHHLLVMRLRPFDPLPSVWALGDGSFTLTITATYPKKEDTIQLTKTVLLPPESYLGSVLTKHSYVLMVNGVPDSGKTTTMNTLASLLMGESSYHGVKAAGGREQAQCKGSTKETNVVPVKYRAPPQMTFFDKQGLEPKHGSRQMLDVAGFPRGDLLKVMQLLYTHGVPVKLDLSNPANCTDAAIQHHAENDKADGRTYQPQMSVIFMKAADVQALAAAARGDSHDHDEEDAGMYNFCQAYQEATQTRAIVVLTKIDEALPDDCEAASEVGILRVEGDSRREALVNEAASVLKVSENDIFLASMRPDKPPKSMPAAEVFFRAAVAAQYIFSKGIERAHKKALTVAAQKAAEKETLKGITYQGSEYEHLFDDDDDTEPAVVSPEKEEGKRKRASEDEGEEEEEAKGKPRSAMSYLTFGLLG